MHVLDVHVGHGRRHLAQHRHPAGEPVDIGHREIDLRLVRRREQVQHRVGRSAHGDIEDHGVLEGLEGRDAPRPHGGAASS